jgi:hypothetical protein
LATWAFQMEFQLVTPHSKYGHGFHTNVAKFVGVTGHNTLHQQSYLKHQRLITDTKIIQVNDNCKAPFRSVIFCFRNN